MNLTVGPTVAMTGILSLRGSEGRGNLLPVIVGLIEPAAQAS